MTDAPIIKDTNQFKSPIPWQRVTNDGYAKLDMELNIGGEIGLVGVYRASPSNEFTPGKFVAYHNSVPISGKGHDKRPAALAEAERYLWSIPLFRGSTIAIVIRAAIEAGVRAHDDGKAVYANPFGDGTTDRLHWLEGWLQAYGTACATKAINFAGHAVAALANEQRAIEFAIEQPGATGIRFLKLRRAQALDDLADDFPAWKEAKTE